VAIHGKIILAMKDLWRRRRRRRRLVQMIGLY